MGVFVVGNKVTITRIGLWETIIGASELGDVKVRLREVLLTTENSVRVVWIGRIRGNLLTCEVGVRLNIWK